VRGGGGLGCVLLVSNLNETDTEPDHLFILFGVYGDVQVERVPVHWIRYYSVPVPLLVALEHSR